MNEACRLLRAHLASAHDGGAARPLPRRAGPRASEDAAVEAAARCVGARVRRPGLAVGQAGGGGVQDRMCGASHPEGPSQSGGKRAGARGEGESEGEAEADADAEAEGDAESRGEGRGQRQGVGWTNRFDVGDRRIKEKNGGKAKVKKGNQALGLSPCCFLTRAQRKFRRNFGKTAVDFRLYYFRNKRFAKISKFCRNFGKIVVNFNEEIFAKFRPFPSEITKEI